MQDLFSHDINYLRIIFEFAKANNFINANIFELYIKALENNELYHEAVKVLIDQQPPESGEDADMLSYYLHIGEDYYLENDYDQAFSYLTKMQKHVFRRTTPLAILNRFDDLRGKLQANRNNFLEAARAFTTIWENPSVPEQKLSSLRKAIICAVLSKISKSRSSLLYRYIDDEDVHKLDVYFILDLIVKRKFIDRENRERFKSIAVKEFGSNGINAIDSSSVQHNISVAEKLFSSIKIDRLSQLIGDSPANVELQLRKMVADKALNAKINQPNKMVLFGLGDESDKDESIRNFCTSVDELVPVLKPLLN
ncbi:COP9 signalosome complex subunit 4 [Histomonas meleagridis]|uniref:COP9 signalosome complex subunit 4 n=1 Tax=Histomonas meleagridis TaxID=135588 RepID=UPI00355A8B6F|nr:COP9 signalosome complex subunit 4 [Histomonas meleagridis]KAH0804612.1 COP9 signalosome complex subunit 4 [Histomonas meleagridis]